MTYMIQTTDDTRCRKGMVECAEGNTLREAFHDVLKPSIQTYDIVGPIDINPLTWDTIVARVRTIHTRIEVNSVRTCK